MKDWLKNTKQLMPLSAFLYQTHLCLSSIEIDVMKDATKILKHFEQVIREISAEKYLTVYKVIPLSRSLQVNGPQPSV